MTGFVGDVANVVTLGASGAVTGGPSLEESASNVGSAATGGLLDDPSKTATDILQFTSAGLFNTAGSPLGDLTGGQAAAAEADRVTALNEARDISADARRQQAIQAILRIFPQAADNRNLGLQGAADIFGQTIPGQLGAVQQGNVGAQRALIQGLSQSQNAILGLPTDFSQFQPQQLNIDTSFAQQQLPDFSSIRDLLTADEAGQLSFIPPQQGPQTPGITAQQQSVLDVDRIAQDIANNPKRRIR